MIKVTRYQCRHCNKDFKTPDRHYCKFNPELKNCFSCKNLRGWEKGSEWTEEGAGGITYRSSEPNYPDCVAGQEEHVDIELLKERLYSLECEKWEEGKYDWSKERDDGIVF